VPTDSYLFIEGAPVTVGCVTATVLLEEVVLFSHVKPLVDQLSIVHIAAGCVGKVFSDIVKL